jgi:membrane protein insertase, YidC/Oxa1 family, C-terminal domain
MLLNGLLNFINQFVGDWGLTIIILTLVVRICLSPLSFKQRINMQKQQVLSKKMEEVKEKYKNDKEKLDKELAPLSMEGAKNMMGCLVTFLQLPIMYSLYRVFNAMPVEVGSALVPWVANLKLPDMYFIIPVISAVIQLIPNILLATGTIKNMSLPKPTKGQMVITVVMNLVFLAKAPVTLGIYWIATGIYSLMEQVAYSLYYNKKCPSN